MSTVLARERAGSRLGGELVDAFDVQALAIAAMAAAPNTRRAYATAYRAFAAFLRARYGEASRETITVASVAAWRDELTATGLAPSSVAQRVSAVRRLAATLGADALVQQVAARTSSTTSRGRCRMSSSSACCAIQTAAPSSGSATARSLSCSRARDFVVPSSRS